MHAYCIKAGQWLVCIFEIFQVRSIKNQQALSDLQMACGGDSRERRRQAIADLQALASQQGVKKFDPSPEDLIRLDRSR